MLRTNLATRPFYNERAVYVVLGLVAAIGLVVLAIGVVQIVDLSRRNNELTARTDEATRASAELTARTVEVQRTVGPQALDSVAAASREANTLIDQRVFSWTNFFNRIETTLPPDVMLTEVRPDIEPGSIEVTMGVLGRRLDAISEFVVALEESGAFAEVLNRQAELTDEGMYRARLWGRYLQASMPLTDGADAGDAPSDPGSAGPAPNEPGTETGDRPEPSPTDADGDTPPTEDAASDTLAEPRRDADAADDAGRGDRQ